MKKTARENFRKSVRENSKVPVTLFKKKRVTGTLGCQGKKKHWLNYGINPDYKKRSTLFRGSCLYEDW